MKTKKIRKCLKCGTETTLKDGICVLCKVGITTMHDDLIGLLKQENDPAILKRIIKKKVN
jgi:hypothetical protein